MSATTSPQLAAWVGLDWAERRHEVSLQATGSQTVEHYTIEHTPEALKIVGLEQVADDAWAVYFGPVRLGWLHEHDYRIMDVLEPARRCR